MQGIRHEAHGEKTPGEMWHSNQCAVRGFTIYGFQGVVVRCRNCGHENPEDNRFCGMCGNLLVGRPLAEAEYAITKTPVAVTHEARTTQESVAAPVEIRREPVEARAEPVELPEPVAPEPAPRSEKWWVDEGEATVGGPSFLGLSSADTSAGGGYSYLFQEEEERSHKAAWAFLLVLLVLGGVVYAKWQPIRDYVLTTALTHARPQHPSAQDNNTQPAAPAGSAPTTTVASSDTQPPPAITETNKAEPAKAGDQKPADPKEGLPEEDKHSAAGSSKPAQQPEKQPAAVADKSSEDEEDAPADEEKPSPSKKARAQTNDGVELVNSGERYLYGRGVQRSCNQAVSYFNAAAAKQNPQAFSHLGALYATGECVPMDRAVAYAWFRRAYAREPSNHYFEQNLTMLWREMSPDEKQRATGGSKLSSF